MIAAPLATQVLIDASTRASKRVRHIYADFDEIVASLKEQGVVPGKPIAITPIFGTTMSFPANTGGGCTSGMPGNKGAPAFPLAQHVTLPCTTTASHHGSSCRQNNNSKLQTAGST